MRVCNESRADVAGRIWDDSGQVIVEDEGIHNRWKTYFSDLLQEDPQGQNDGERVPVTVEEVEIAISKLKNGKSPVICGISAEMLKAGRTV